MKATKNILITGGSQGIGKAIAVKFAQNNWKVLINYKENDEEAIKTLKELKKIGEAELFKADVSNLFEVEQMVEKINKENTNIDVLVNNAGIIKDNIILKQTEEEWDKVIKTNLKGVFNVSKAVVKFMIKKRQGHIINISSISAVRGSYGQAGYSASKAAVIGFSKTLAREVGIRNIKVNVIMPGLVLTKMGNTIGEEKIKDIIIENCLNRLNEPFDVADFVYYLANTNNISGQVFNIDSRIY